MYHPFKSNHTHVRTKESTSMLVVSPGSVANLDRFCYLLFRLWSLRCRGIVQKAKRVMKLANTERPQNEKW